MNIQPTPGTASLAGTQRAQARGTDSDRRSPAADIAADPRLSSVAGVEAGSQTNDRDADGRQTLAYPEPREPAPDSHEEPNPEADGTTGGPTTDSLPPAADGSVTHLDFQA